VTYDVFALANVGVQGLHPYQPGKPIEELQRELGLDSVVKLASNENPLGPSSAAMAAAQTALKQMHLYPDASGFELKKKLAAKLGVTEKQFTLGNGSNDILDLIARTFLSAGSSAVFSQHAFIVYPIAVQAAGARAIITPAKNWGHDLVAMAAAIEPDTKVVFIANPNNPTGNYLDSDAVSAFLAKVPEHVIVVLDEAYVEFAEVDDFPDGLGFLAQYPNVIVTRTFSKAYGLAGLRIGYGISSPQITDLLNRVRAPFNVNIPAMSAALAVLDDHDYLRRSRQVNSAGMAQLCAGFNELNLAYIPSVGNFVAVELPCDAMPVYQALLREGVIVRPVGVYQMPKHLRVSIGLEHENARFLTALRKLIGEGCLD
jgi:histidinol-phosphate aminotransferase